MKNLITAFKAFWLVLSGADLVARQELEAAAEPVAPPTDQPGKNKTSRNEKTVAVDLDKPFQDGAVYALILLQREGRLIDFLKESIEDYPDEQIGTAVRQIHTDCGKVLTENFHIEPVLEAIEGESFQVTDGFDPSAVKLTGNVPKEPPYAGILRHKGWKAAKIHFPTRSGKIDPAIIQAAEVEM